jgi:hypothetical protein
MYRWFKIVFSLGIVTIFLTPYDLTPYDPEDDPTPAVAIAKVMERGVRFLRLDRRVAPELQQARQRSLFLTPALRFHFKVNSSIIDLTCARLC